MKKAIVILAIIITILAINKEDKIVIPKDAIRFRVIANSNEEQDQSIKKEVVENLNGEIRKLTILDTSLENSRNYFANTIADAILVQKLISGDFEMPSMKNTAISQPIPPTWARGFGRR